VPGIIRSIVALLLGVGLLLIGHGTLITMVPLRAVTEAFTSLQIGLLGAAYYLGFVVGCVGTPFVILRAGHIRTFTALVALATASALILPLAIDFWPWFGARVIMGVSLAGLFMVIESWLNDRASNDNRGLVFGAYIAVNYGAIAIGQLIVTAGDTNGFETFLAAGLALVLATIPVALTRSAQPAPIALVRFKPVDLFKRSPVAFVGVSMIGLATGAFWTLAALFVVQSGMSSDDAALFVAFAVVGGMLAQWPIGHLSDRFDRRYVLFGLLLLSAMIGLAIGFLPLGRIEMLIAAVPLGGTLLSGYSIAIAHAFDHAERSEFVETSAGLLFANGVGSMIGPIAASALMGAVGAGGLFAFAAAAQVGLAGFVYYRVRQRGPVVGEHKVGFTVGATSQAGGVLTPDGYAEESPDVVMPEPVEDQIAEAAAEDEVDASAAETSPDERDLAELEPAGPEKSG